VQTGPIVGFQQFDQLADAVSLAGQDHSSSRFEHALLGHVGAADRVEQADGRLGITGLLALLGAQNAAFGDG
jgi:hypothetical protein